MSAERMAGPLCLRLPANASLIDVFALTGEGFEPDKMDQYMSMARENGTARENRAREVERALIAERLLTQTKASLHGILSRFEQQLNTLLIPSWDELIDNPDACDSLALSERPGQLEYQVAFVRDANDRLEVRIRQARLARLKAAWESKKTDSLDAQLLAIISYGAPLPQPRPSVKRKGTAP
jgi:hypothetical protein